MTDVSELANYLLYLDKKEAQLDGEDAESDMTPLKIQKLLYYCQGYSLGLYKEPLFAESIEAWEHGPVVKSIYNKYHYLRSSNIPFEGEKPEIDERAKKIAQFVMHDKGCFAPSALRNMTHGERPWDYTYNKLGRNSVIAEKIMQEFFSSIFDKESSPEEEEAVFLAAGTRPNQQEWREINEYVAGL